MYKNDNGEIMLEGMIVVLITTLMLVWILGVGFLFYQKYLVTSITNDAASKVAATYNNPGSDLIMGYISTEDLAGRDLYRGFTNNSLYEVNKGKASSYVEYRLKKTNFAGTISDVAVDLELCKDSPLRKHITVKTTCTFNTPFGIGLEIFGMDGKRTYEAYASADCTDVIDYISTVDFAASQLGGGAVNSKVITFINSLIKIFNHRYQKS